MLDGWVDLMGARAPRGREIGDHNVFKAESAKGDVGVSCLISSDNLPSGTLILLGVARRTMHVDHEIVIGGKYTSHFGQTFDRELVRPSWSGE